MEIEYLPFSTKNSTWTQRHSYLCHNLEMNSKELNSILLLQDIDLCDKLIESAVGYFSVPLGVAWSFPVNGRMYNVPVATEEPSVVAALNYMAKIFQENPIQIEVNGLSFQVRFISRQLTKISENFGN